MGYNIRGLVAFAGEGATSNRTPVRELVVFVVLASKKSQWAEIADLNDELGFAMSDPTISRSLSRLASRGLVEFFPSPTGDGRARAARLTAAGKQLAATLGV